jgi:AmmeMemoRadiSam system protein A
MTDGRGDTLLALARSAIAERLGLGSGVEASGDWLQDSGATFVTLMRHGQLRGCIGSLEAQRPLRDDVRINAVAAAFRDPRFPPLTGVEFDDTRIELSLLSPQTPIDFESEADALRQLQPGIDGVVLEYGMRRGTFLPQVWEQLQRPQDFLAHLKTKAGLPTDFWDKGIALSRYSVTKWKEHDQRV